MLSKITVRPLGTQRRNVSYYETSLSVRRILFLFGIQQPTMDLRTTTDFISNITYSRSTVYMGVCALSYH